MGHYHGSFPENVQQDKTRHRCGICGIKKYTKFMYEVIWQTYKWACNDCGKKHKLDSYRVVMEGFK